MRNSNQHYRFLKVVAAAAAVTGLGGVASAATVVWTPGGVGNLSDATKYNGGVAPVSGDNVEVNGTGSIVNYMAGDLAIAEIGTLLMANPTDPPGGQPIFNQDAGAGTSLTIASLQLGNLTQGASRTPVYNVHSGTLNISTSLVFGAGNSTVGGVQGSQLNVLEGATFNYNGAANLSVSRGAGSVSNIRLIGGTMNVTAASNIYLANVATGSGTTANLVLADGPNGTGATLDAPNTTLVVGQFANSQTTLARAILTMSGNATLNAATVVIGGANASSAVNGNFNLNGGTLSTGTIILGNNNQGSSATTNAFNANGGTIRATRDGNFFMSFDTSGTMYVNLGDNGLTFDTNGFAATTRAPLHGTGSLTKIGEGTLTLNGASDHSGGTTVSAGTLAGTGSLSSGLVVSSAATLSPGGSAVGTFTNSAATTLDGTLAIDIDGGFEGSPAGADQLITAGLTLGSGALLTFTLLGDGSSFTDGQVLTLIDNTSADPIGGLFANLAEGAVLSFGSFNLTATYAGIAGIDGIANDLLLTVSATSTAVPGDYNGDGFVDSADYTVWADHFGQTGSDIPGDGNGDGVVDSADYTVWADNFGQGTPPGAVAVPEPAALASVLPAIALLGRRRRA